MNYTSVTGESASNAWLLRQFLENLPLQDESVWHCKPGGYVADWPFDTDSRRPRKPAASGPTVSYFYTCRDKNCIKSFFQDGEDCNITRSRCHHSCNETRISWAGFFDKSLWEDCEILYFVHDDAVWWKDNDKQNLGIPLVLLLVLILQSLDMVKTNNKILR